MQIGIVHYAAPPVVGGVELTIFHHARILTDLGHHVTVVADKGAPFWPGVTFWAEPLIGSRSPEIQAATQHLAQGHLPPDFDSLVTRVKDTLLRHLSTCDVIVGHNFFTLHKNLALTAAVQNLVQTGQGPPWVAWHHDFAWLRPQYQPELHPGFPWDLLRQPWPGLRHATVSTPQRDDLARLYGISPDSITVIPPGVDPLAFHRVGPKIGRLCEAWNLLEADCLFLLPARITRRKNIELGLRWLGALRDRSGWDARLLITGPPGPHNPTNAAYLDQLLTLRATLGLDAAAHFVYQASALFPDTEPGAPLLLSDDDVAACYSIADALLFPSLQEGFGIPVLEASLARLPIFATNLPPFRDALGSTGVATLFDPQTPPDAVAHTILTTLAADHAFQRRRNVLANFTWRGIVAQHILPLLQAEPP